MSPQLLVKVKHTDDTRGDAVEHPAVIYFIESGMSGSNRSSLKTLLEVLPKVGDG